VPAVSGGRRLRALLRRRAGLVTFLAVLGPGLITASADNDAQGITTYSVAGARTGFKLLWLLILVIVALAVTQEMGARLGMATGKGLGALVRERFGVRAAAWAMALLLLANLGTIAAEFAGIATAVQIFGVNKYISVPIAAVGVFALVARGSYKRIEVVFLLLSVVYLAYVISGILAHPPWSEALRSMVVPSVVPTRTYLVAAVTLVGTTVTPWGQFFIQAYVIDKGLTIDDLNYERADVFVGSFTTGFIAFFIIVAAAVTIFATQVPVNDAADLAVALRPLAGDFASTLFAIGFLNASLLAACVLPLATAYPICEAFGFELGVDRKIREAPVFYGVFGFSILFGACIVLLPVPLLPILLVTSAVNGVLLAPILVFLYILCNDPDVIGERRNGRLANVLSGGMIGLLLLLTAAILLLTFLPSG
jgi:NRAMP (natural resistance-associated macrophage protein)-like metal ion transporter